jgi:hypothetical protein
MIRSELNIVSDVASADTRALTCIINLMGASRKLDVSMICVEKPDVSTHPYPTKKRRAVAQHFNDLGVRLQPIEKRLEALHVPHALSRSKLSLDLFRGIAHIAQCGVAELAIVGA